MNLFKLPDGNVQALVNNRPFLSGEVFVQTVKVDDTNTYKENSIGPFYDAVTGAPIKKFFAGDLYGGTGDWKSRTATYKQGTGIGLYQLGSGNALKFAADKVLLQYWNEASRAEVRDHPNTLYLYVGNPKVTSGQLANAIDWNDSSLVDDTVAGYEDGSSFKINNSSGVAETGINHSHFGDAGRAVTTNSLSDDLNTGDMVFYSPVYDMFMVWHLSRTTSNLVRMLTANLTSASLKAEMGADFTLSDYVNKVARDYQRLDEKEGWVELKAVDTEDNNSAVTFEIPSDVTDKDGMVYHVPFTITKTITAATESSEAVTKDYFLNFAETSKYVFRNSSDGNDLTVWPGDVVITVPLRDEDREAKAADGTDLVVELGVKHVVVSLYGDWFKKKDLSTITITRADDYADQRNLLGENGDIALEEAIQKGEKGLKDIIENIYKTKVDIDPSTHKIVTSQLPSFVLGGMKYSGNISLDDFTGFTSAKQVVYTLIARAYANELEDAGVWTREISDTVVAAYGDIDANGDVTDSAYDYEVVVDAAGNTQKLSEIITSLNEETEAAVGSYFIWNGDHVSITEDGTTQTTKEVTTEFTKAWKVSISSDGALTLTPWNKDANVAIEDELAEGPFTHSQYESGVDAEGSPLYTEYTDWGYSTDASSVFVKDVLEDGQIIPYTSIIYEADEDVTNIVGDHSTDSATGTITTTEVDKASVAMNVFFSETAKKGTDDAQSEADHTSAELNNGDFLIFNGSTFDTIDNTSSITALSFKDEDHTTLKLLTGTPLLTHEKRHEAVQAWVDGKIKTVNTDLNEYEVDITQSGNDLTFNATHSVMVDEKNTPDIYHLPVLDPTSQVLVSSPIKMQADATNKGIFTKLSIDTAYDDDDASKTNTAVFDFAEKLYALAQGEAADSKKLVSSYLSDITKYSPIWETTDEDAYGDWSPVFERDSATQPILNLPVYSGTLTTEEYVQNAVKTLFDIIEAEVANQVSGTEDWIQTIVEYVDPSDEKKTTKRIYDSSLKQTVDATNGKTTFEILNGAKGTNKTEAAATSKVSAKADLTDVVTELSSSTPTPSWHSQITEGSDGTLTYADGYDPRKAADMEKQSAREVYLPNHGGVVLTSDSIIDCGTWL